jgi:hypothetical protein
MNAFRTFLILTAVSAMFFMPFAHQAGAVAPGPKVSEVSVSSGGNKHNLSAKAWPNAYSGAYNTVNLVSNPNTTYKATDDPTGNPKGQQICIFCHTPHSANVEGGAPLWNRRFSTETFSRYSSGTLQIRLKSATTTATAGYDASWQPDGSSKLCLSCHDGVNTTDHRLGDVLNGGPIAMTNDVITGIASFNPTNNKMKTGHHPVSFVYDATIRDAILSSKPSYTLPPTSGALAVVKLDKNSKMQCTTCHNAHQNQTDDDDCYGGSCTPTSRKKTPFWVYGASGVAPTDRDAVCQACHPLDAGAPGFTTPWPTP